MGQGLGKNSPVILTLGKDNYEALLDRHGQWTRWRTAKKCTCVNTHSMQPDIHCKFCGGLGSVYSYQKSHIIYVNVMVKDTSGILEVSNDYLYANLVKVYDFWGYEYKNAEKLGRYIKLNSTKLPKKSSYITIVMKETITKFLEQAVLRKATTGYYFIDELLNAKGYIDGLYHESPSDIVNIEKIVDANGQEFKVKEYRLNSVLLEDKYNDIDEIIEPLEPLTAIGIKYLEPFIFAILNQNLSKADEQMVVDTQGDAILLFPYGCDVGNDDIVTVLAGTYTQKDVMVRTDFETDTIGAYFVEEITSCFQVRDSEAVIFEQGKDFVIVSNNKIKWLDSGDGPEPGEAYSVVYKIFPTYKVCKAIPQLRTSENQRFPKKAVVKLFASYSENRKANVQR